MKSAIARVFDMLQRVHRCILENPIAPELPRATAAQLEIVAIISALSVAAKNQVGGRQESTGGVQRREICWRALRRYLAQINHTARTLEPEHPGIRPTFRLPRTRSYPALLAAARSIVAAATPLKSSFIACGLPENFLEEVTTLLADFEAATTQKLGGKITQVASTAELKEQAARGIAAATKLDACMRNHFRHNPDVLAAWKHARHIERAPSRSSTSTPSTPSTPSAASVPSVPQIDSAAQLVKTTPQVIEAGSQTVSTAHQVIKTLPQLPDTNSQAIKPTQKVPIAQTIGPCNGSAPS